MLERQISTTHDDHFNTLEDAEGYARETERSARPLYRRFWKRLKTIPVGERVLDVGAGTGYLAAQIGHRYPSAHITAVDCADAMVEYGRGYVEREGLSGRVEFLAGDAGDRDFVSSLGSFDLVYSTLTMHHFQNPERVVRLLLDALKPDGRLLLFDMRRVWWLYWLPSKSGLVESSRCAFNKPELRKLLLHAGATHVEVEKVFPFMILALATR